MRILLLLIVLLAIAGGGGWYYYSSTQKAAGETAADTTISTTANVLEQTGVVARVNGTDITAEQVVVAARQIAAAQGVTNLSQLDEATSAQLGQQALAGSISHELVLQAAKEAGITVSSADIAAELQATKDRFENDEAYQEALTQQGVTEAQLQTQITEGLITQAYFEETLAIDDIAATEEEIQAQYDSAVATAGEDSEAPALEDIRGQIESFVIQQKQQQVVNEHIQQLHEDANIEILI